MKNTSLRKSFVVALGIAGLLLVQGAGMVTTVVAALTGRTGVVSLGVAEGGDTPKKGGGIV